MRDHRAAAAALRARFRLARRALPSPERVLLALAGRRPASPTAVPATTVNLSVSPRIQVNPAAREILRRTDVRHHPVTLPAAVPPGLTRVVHTHRVDASATALTRTQRYVTTLQHQLTRTEQRIPQAVQVVNRPAAAAAAESSPGQSRRPAAVGPPPGGSQPAPLPAGWPQPDLGRITEHVLGVIDHRLTAYSERLGRG